MIRHARANRSQVTPPRLRVAVLVFLLFPTLIVGCTTGTAPEPLEADLPTIPADGASEAELTASRRELANEIGLHLAAITGRPLTEARPIFEQLKEGYENIAEGINVLYLTRDDHGLAYRESIGNLIRALEHHYAVLRELRVAAADLTDLQDRAASPDPDIDTGSASEAPPEADETPQPHEESDADPERDASDAEQYRDADEQAHRHWPRPDHEVS